eukprot:1098507-Pleurochrysis_carterae.AAC.1
MNDLLVRADVDLRSEASTHQFMLSALKRGRDMGNMTLVIFATQCTYFCLGGFRLPGKGLLWLRGLSGGVCCSGRRGVTVAERAASRCAAAPPTVFAPSINKI